MEIFHAVILGIIEGITEFLPISSTGHLILSSHALDLEQTDFLKTFEISIQLGAILSVVVLYWRKLLVNFEIIKRIALAFIPTGILGLAFYKIVKTYLMESQLVIVASLFIGGIILILFEVWYEKKKKLKRDPSVPQDDSVVSADSSSIPQNDPNTTSTNVSGYGASSDDVEDISYKNSVLIGIFQSIAMIPGVSRSGATIVGGLSLGLSRKTIVEFSFLLAVPTMVAATGLDLFKNAGSFNQDQFGILAVGFIISFFIALLSIKWLLKFIKNHSFIWFGVYRIVISILFFLVIF